MMDMECLFAYQALSQQLFDFDLASDKKARKSGLILSDFSEGQGAAIIIEL